MFIGKLLFTIGIGTLLLGGYQTSLLLRGTEAAEVVSIEELGQETGTNNVHLTVTDFVFGEYIVTYKKDGTPARTWFPLLTKAGNWTQRPVVLHSKHATSPITINQVLQQRTVTGVVSNFMQSLGKSQREQFAAIYPNDDLSGAIALELNGTMPSPWLAFPLFCFGIISTAFGCCSLFKAAFTAWGKDDENWGNKPLDTKPSVGRFDLH